MESREGRSEPMIFAALFIMRCSWDFECSSAEPYQTVIDEEMML